MKKIVAICGSASSNSGNLSILKYIAKIEKSDFDFEIIDDLHEFPSFQTALTEFNVPKKIKEFRKKIETADGIIICTPEYVFSIPSGLKNLIEWCVSTVVFSDKPIGLITASSHGEKGHEELQLIMKTVQTVFNEKTTLLIPRIKAKVDKGGMLKDESTIKEIKKLTQSLSDLIELKTQEK